MITTTDLIGTFFFEIESSNGDLKGEYLNNVGYKKSTETAKKQSGSSPDPFDGIYDSCWFDGNQQQNAQLTITSNKDGYDLEWVNALPNEANYKGVGTKYKGTLIGGYWKV